MPTNRPAARRLVPLWTALVLLTACAVNPATGDRQFTALLPPAQEASLGAEEHPKIVAQFGGETEGPQLRAFVAGVGRRLAAVSERPELDWRFTVLDSSVVNAFALPGGYVYVTRGLVALAEDEAEVAGVLAHEIGHVTARHTAERLSQSAVAGVLTAGLGAVLGSPELGRALNVGGQAVLASYSRGQELEADGLGVRYLARAGYDPFAMATFLETMRRNEQYEALRAGRGDSGFDFFATHPQTEDRVERAAALAGDHPPNPQARPADAYFQAVNGMVWGDSRDDGFVRANSFVHPGMRLRFSVPPDFSLLNGARQVVARSPQGAAIVFDTRASGADPADHITRQWAPGAALSDLQRLTVGGLPAATAVTAGRTNDGPVDIRLLAIRSDDGTIFRFAFAAPSGQLAAFDSAFRGTAASFERLSAAEAASYQPQRIRVIAVGPGDTVQSLAARMAPEPYAEELFRIINNLPPGASLRPGQLVKIVS